MKFRAALTLALLWAAPVLAVTPTAGIKAPANATVGDTIFVQLVDCAGDRSPWLKSRGPETLKPLMLFDAQGKPACALVTFSQPGTFTFAVVSLGTPDGQKDPDVAIAVCDVAVSLPAPPPAPTPQPTPQPQPTPGPTPPPAPTPVADVGTVYVSLISDANSKTQAFAQIEADKDLRAAISALPGHLNVYDVSNKALDPGYTNLRQYIVAGGPTLCIQGDKTKQIVAVRCPGTSAEILTAVQRFKGK